MAGSKKLRKEQMRIAFTPIPSSSPAAKGYHQQVKDRAAAVRYKSGSPSPAKRRKVQLSSSNHELMSSDGYLPTPDSPVEAPVTSQGRLRSIQKARQQQLNLSAQPATKRPSSMYDEASKSNTSDDSDTIPVRSTKKRRTGATGFLSSASTTRTRGQSRLGFEQASNANDLESSPPTNAGLDIDSDSLDGQEDMPTTLGTRKRGSQRSRVPLPSSPPLEELSDDDLEVIEVRKRPASAELSDDDVVTATPRRGKLKSSKAISQQDRSDLADDLDFLEPDDDADAPRQPRSSQNVQKTARMKALDVLKRRRSGRPAIEADQEPEEDEETNELDPMYIGSDAEDEVPASSRSMFQANEEDEDFLVQDDDETLGVPEDLPLEFSKYASMKGRELFQYAVEWMVQKKINPAFNMTDGLYDLTFKKLNDEMSALASSEFSSSAWTADFTMSLRARPAIAVRTLDRSEDAPNHCDACNRSKHPATMEIQFQGKPYHLETLDDVELKDDDDDKNDSDASSEQDGVDDADDKPSYDAQGRTIPPASTIYRVGSTCGANAETAHELWHWKLNLYDWVVKWIEDSGYTAPHLLVERDRWSTKKRRKFANKLATLMTAKGVTKKLWKDWNDAIKRAREPKQSRYARRYG